MKGVTQPLLLEKQWRRGGRWREKGREWRTGKGRWEGRREEVGWKRRNKSGVGGGRGGREGMKEADEGDGGR